MAIGADTTLQKLVDSFLTQSWSMWASLTPGDWWNDGITQAVAGRAALLELSLIMQARRLGLSYATASLKAAGITSKTANGLQLIYPRFNTTPWDVMHRTALAYRSQAVKTPTVRPASWSSTGSEDKATVQRYIDAAYSTMRMNAFDDSHSGMNQSTLDQYSNSGVTEYVRVLHPELSRTGSCGFCAVVSTRVFKTKHLMPLHHNCRCGVAPVNGETGVGLDPDDLQKVYDAAFINRADDTSKAKNNALMNQRVTIRPNGELGAIIDRNHADEKPVLETNVDQPDRQMTRQALERMRTHARNMAGAYKDMIANGYDRKSYRIDGHTYIFKKSAHMRQAMQWNEDTYRRLSLTMAS